MCVAAARVDTQRRQHQHVVHSHNPRWGACVCACVRACVCACANGWSRCSPSLDKRERASAARRARSVGRPWGPLCGGSVSLRTRTRARTADLDFALQVARVEKVPAVGKRFPGSRRLGLGMRGRLGTDRGHCRVFRQRLGRQCFAGGDRGARHRVIFVDAELVDEAAQNALLLELRRVRRGHVPAVGPAIALHQCGRGTRTPIRRGSRGFS